MFHKIYLQKLIQPKEIKTALNNNFRINLITSSNAKMQCQFPFIVNQFLEVLISKIHQYISATLMLLIGKFFSIIFLFKKNLKIYFTKLNKSCYNHLQILLLFIMTPEAERFNGWAAMLGFVAAVGAYVTTGQIIPGWF